MVDEHPKERGKANPSKFKIWERIGIIVSIVAVVGTLGFSIWDKIDYRRQIAKSEEQIAKTAYDKLYSDVAQGRYSGTRLKDAIKRILEHGDDLSGMNLSKKWLDGINLKGENLYAVNFSESTFYSKDESTKNKKLSDFSWSNLEKANLKEANLGFANLQNANLQEANLGNAYLPKATLVFANLREANLSEAHLPEANFYNADLREAQNLTIEQLSKVKTLYKAKLDLELMGKVKEKYPHLLEKPKSEKEKQLEDSKKE